jgi:hypothetical protein
LKPEDAMAPMKYRSRYRIGRGGRLVVDRVPVYNDVNDSTPDDANINNNINSNDSKKDYLFQYPFMLPTSPVPVNTNPLAATTIKPFQSSHPVPQSHPIHPLPTAQPVTQQPPQQQQQKITMNALAQLNNENLLKTANGLLPPPSQLPVAAVQNNLNNNNTIPPQVPLPSIPTTASSSSIPLLTKPLPEIPLSNRRFLITHKKNNKHLFSNQQWSNALPYVFQQIPPMIPPPKPLLSQEKAKRLNEILQQSDSEDEKIVIPRGSSGMDIGKSICDVESNLCFSNFFYVVFL